MVRHEILQIKHLPPLSVTANRLLESATNPDVDLTQLADIIKHDPGLTARIVGLANSAYFSPPHPIASVEEAIIRVLGLDMVRSLALSVAMCGSFQAKDCPGFDLEDYWSKSLGSATLSRMLAMAVDVAERPDPDGIYLCGLMYNLGALVLAHVFPGPMSEALGRAKADPMADMLQMEHDCIGVDRAEAGEWLSSRWHLPEEVVHVIGHLNDLTYDGPYWQSAMLVGAASRWVRCYLATGETGLAADEALQRVPGLDAKVLSRVEAQFLGQSEAIFAMSRLLSVS
jgi:HD-like signal output (HDOD) protein